MARHCPALALSALALVATPLAAQVQLGTKIMGGLGIDAGIQGPPGFYIIDRFIQFHATKARGREGNELPIRGLDIMVRANSFGVAYALTTANGPTLTFALAAPYAHGSINSDDPFVSVDRLGLGDVFVQPIKVGWQRRRYDVVTSYGFFAPTGEFEPRSGLTIGHGQWSHQFSLGGGLFTDSTRTTRASALLSYELNGRKRGIDITRGDMLQLQGGAGMTVRKIVVVGVAGYALWQVRDDRGSDLPPALAGARTRTFGLGPEIDVVIPKLRMRGEFRFEWDFGTRARPQGDVFAGGLAYRAWAPAK